MHQEHALGLLYFFQNDKDVPKEIKESSNKWGLPKGHIKAGEELTQCASREIEEETGLKIDINDKNPRIKINDTYYYIIIMNENVYLSPKDKREIAEVRWERVENMSKINTNRGLRKLDSVFPKIVKLAKKCIYFIFKKMNTSIFGMIVLKEHSPKMFG